MAIDNGISIGCTDLQRTGGISQIMLRSWTDDTNVVYGNAAGEHDIDSILEVAAAADWKLFQFKDETPTLNVTATKENGSTSFECVLSFYLPQMTNIKFHELQAMLNTCMMGIVKDTNGKYWCIGVSEKYEVSGNQEKSQTYLDLTSMEGQTGAAYSEENGITVVLTARQFELPREYVGTVVVNTGTLSCTTAA